MRKSRFVVSVVCLALIAAFALLSSNFVASAAPGHDKVVSAVPSSTPAIGNGQINDIVAIGTQMVAGGTFTTATSVGGSSQTRNYVLSFDASSGQLSSSFVPNVNGAIQSLLPGPVAGTVYIAGSFTQVNGTNASHLALLNISNGNLVSGFKAAPTNGVVNDLGRVGSRLYVGGSFSIAGGTAHAGLASMNASTGALDAFVNNQVAIHHNDSGSGAQGAVGVRQLDIKPDGTRLVAIGNFKQIDNLPRDQVAQLSLSGSTSTVVADWNTNRYQPYCFNWAFDTYVRGVAYSPDGSYFVVTATGGQNAGTLCDTAARFETNASGTAIQPTWVDYTGGDTLWSVAVTEKAVYVGGHQRWLNNSFASDKSGPGAVPRPGIAALNTTSGMPLSWNPGRNPRGAAAFVIYPTPTGLWVGSDTEWIGNYKYKRPRIAYFPLAQGASEASDSTALLPGTVYVGGPKAAESNVLYRVNAGGPTISAADGGPDWEGDDSSDSAHRNSGSNAAGWPSGASQDSSVPTSTPSAIFDSERWSPSDNPAMQWTFPVQAGAPVQVRLYFANRCSCTSGAGQRSFDVNLDSNKVLDNFDIVKSVGDQKGTMKSFDIESDGTVNINFSHDVENPLVDGIEIVRTDIAPNPTGTDGLFTASFDGTHAGPLTSAEDGGITWSHTRGSFLAGGQLFYGYDDGYLYKRSFNGSSFGPAVKVDPYNDPIWAGVSTGSGNTYDGTIPTFYGQISQVNGMFYSGGRLYYTRSGQSALFWRWFNVDSGIVGADEFQASGGLSWGNAGGMFATGNKLYFASRSTGALSVVTFADGSPQGTPSIVDSPANEGNDWRGRAVFLGSATAPNQAPIAAFTLTCSNLSCSFNGGGSSDSDGSIASYEWDFGDGSIGAGAGVSHSYAGPGTYTVQLKVTDNGGLTGTESHSAEVTMAPSSSISFVGERDAVANNATPLVGVPTEAQMDDQLLLTVSVGVTKPAVTTPAGWTLLDSKTSTGMVSYVYVRQATSADPGTQVSVKLDAVAKTSLSVTAYRNVRVSNPVSAYASAADTATAKHTTPTAMAGSNSRVVSYWTDKSSSTSAWTAPSGVTARLMSIGTGSGRVGSLLADASAPAGGGTVGGITATTDTTSSRGIAWTIILASAN